MTKVENLGHLLGATHLFIRRLILFAGHKKTFAV